MSNAMRLLDTFCGAGGAAVGSDTERAWAAGFFDGEGSVWAYFDKRPGRRPGIGLQVEQADIRPLQRFREAIGVKCNITRRPEPRGTSRRRTYRIYLTNSKALSALAAMWPWLSEPKQEQFRSALSKVGEDRFASIT